MSTDTLNSVVEIVKDRAQERASSRKFFMDNGRRMWGLPQETGEEKPIKVAVQHEGIPKDGVSVQHQGLPTSDIAVHHDGIPRQPSQPPSAQVTTALPKWFIPSIVAVAVALASYGLGSWFNGDTETDPTPETKDTTIIKEEGSVLQYLEDIGEHRP